LRVLCVDDNELMADALRRRFEQESALAWEGIITQGSLAYDRILEVRPDIVLMDIDMPNIDTFTIVERLCCDVPEIRVLMFSGHVSPKDIDRALDCGAWGYLSKNDDVTKLIDAITRAGRGELVFSYEVDAVRGNR